MQTQHSSSTGERHTVNSFISNEKVAEMERCFLLGMQFLFPSLLRAILKSIDESLLMEHYH
ncbi:hypothetical protein LINPERHAP2_LOCUS35572 [Linum perenne]